MPSRIPPTTLLKMASWNFSLGDGRGTGMHIPWAPTTDTARGTRHTWPHRASTPAPGARSQWSPWSHWKSGDWPKDSEQVSGEAQCNHRCICTAQHLAPVTQPEVCPVSPFRPWAAKMFFLTGCHSSSLSSRITDSLTNQRPQRRPLNFLLRCIDRRPNWW